jgi:hypothetical protein
VAFRSGGRVRWTKARRQLRLFVEKLIPFFPSPPLPICAVQNILRHITLRIIDLEAELLEVKTARGVHIYGACWCSCMCEVARPRSGASGNSEASFIPTNIRTSGLIWSLPFPSIPLAVQCVHAELVGVGGAAVLYATRSDRVESRGMEWDEYVRFASGHSQVTTRVDESTLFSRFCCDFCLAGSDWNLKEQLAATAPFLPGRDVSVLISRP